MLMDTIITHANRFYLKNINLVRLLGVLMLITLAISSCGDDPPWL